jgi:hypothetical protein
LVHEHFGGELLKTPLPEGDHFYNRIDGVRPVGRNSAAYCADRQLKSAEYAIARRRRA